MEAKSGVIWMKRPVWRSEDENRCYTLDAIIQRTYLAICFSLSPYYLPWKNEIYEAILFQFADCCSLFFQEKRSNICRKDAAKTIFHLENFALFFLLT